MTSQNAVGLIRATSYLYKPTAPMKALLSLLIASLLFELSVTAQSTTAVESSASPPEQYAQITVPEQGYWRVVTEPDTRSTLVRFFNHDRQIVYEERLSGRYIKLNDRNVAQLDQTLARLTGGNLVAATVKTEPLYAEKDYYKERPTMPLPPAPAGLLIESLPTISQDKLLVRFQNPEGYRMHIAIRDNQGRDIYNDSVVQTVYQRKFNLSQLPSGFYTLTVSDYKGKVRHTRTFRLGQANNLTVIQ